MLSLGIIAGALVVFVVFQLSGNRATRRADQPTRAAALQLAARPGIARLYLVRQGIVGRAVGADVTLDDRIVAQLKGGQFTVVDVVPGLHTVEMRSSRLGARAACQILLADGGVSAVRAQNVLSWTRRGSIRLTEVTDVADLVALLPHFRMVEADTNRLD